jgi:predicted PhzF superfamily epimerase YddE/YHI9
VLYETGVVTPVAPVVVLDAPGRVEAVRPDPAQIRRLPVSRVLVTAAGGGGADFTSRNFAPAVGRDEDQATGSAHTALGPPWAARLGRPRLSAVPASPRRGRLAVAVEDERICVGGQAVTITRGERLAEP